MTQPRMDFARDAFDSQPVPVRDSHVLAPAEIARLSAQNRRILARLQQGKATRRELTDIALNPTARLSDLRAVLRPKGISPEVIEEHPNGLTIYDLVPWPRPDEDGEGE